MGGRGDDFVDFGLVLLGALFGGLVDLDLKFIRELRTECLDGVTGVVADVTVVLLFIDIVRGTADCGFSVAAESGGVSSITGDTMLLSGCIFVRVNIPLNPPFESLLSSFLGFRGIRLSF